MLLTTNGDTKLADFGVAEQLTASTSKANKMVGTPYWMSPEVVKRTGYDSRADIWSVGILAIELASGQPPYAELHPMKVLHLISRNPPPTLHPTHSKIFRDFVAQCLVRDPTQRPSAAALLKHRFVRNTRDPSALGALVLLSQRTQVYKSVARRRIDTELRGEPWDFTVTEPDMFAQGQNPVISRGNAQSSRTLSSLFR